MKTTVTLADGATTEVIGFPAVGPSKAVLYLLPALGVPISYYSNFMKALSEQGYSVAGVELRGVGLSSTRASKSINYGYKEIILEDMPLLFEVVQSLFPGQTIYGLGHSLGGQICLLHAAHSGIPLEGVAGIAAGSNFFTTVGGLHRFRRFGEIFIARTIAQTLGYFPGDKLKFAGLAGKHMILDWSYEGLTGRYRVINSDVDLDEKMNRLALRVLFLSLSGDTYVPAGSAARLARKLLAADVELKELQASDFGLKVFDHFRWVKQPKPIVDELVSWIESQ
ncbi:MAG: alpha/beta fold hydrolase [Pseudobacteriovorax sp.]|nr:alpha/beta fold hydrolase [Pseudobacteriovorax sp.]